MNHRGKRLEEVEGLKNNQIVVDRWIHNEDRRTKTPSLRKEHQDMRFEQPLREDEYEYEHRH